MVGDADESTGSTGGETVSREVILAVLRGNGVDIKNTSDGCWLLLKGEVQEKRKLATFYHRRFLYYLARRFAVPIHDFFHPEQHMHLVEKNSGKN